MRTIIVYCILTGLLILWLAALFHPYIGVTCLTQRTESGQYAVTSCRIGGDPKRLLEELPDDPGYDSDPPETVTRIRPK